MTVSMSMGGDWRYLMKHVEETTLERERSVADSYYLRAAEHGEPPGEWLGIGAEALGLTGKVERQDMKNLYGKLLHPETKTLLGSKPRDFKTYDERLAVLLDKEPGATPERVAVLELKAHKSGRQARMYADVTFSPPKSWSVVHAALESQGRHEEAAMMWDSLEKGVAEALQYLQEEAGYSRSGYHGKALAGRTSGRFIEAPNMVISTWRHHTSRDGEPQLHVHAAVLNRVECADGKWRSLDSKGVNKVLPAVAAVFHRVAEQDAQRTIGLDFATRPDGVAREIVGVDAATRDLHSSRRRAINKGVAELAKAYEEQHGKVPNAYQLTKMAQFVTLETRARKPDQSPTREALLAAWEAKTVDRLGKSFKDVLKDVRIDSDRAKSRRRGDDDRFVNADIDLDTVIAQAVGRLESSKTVWNRYDLIGQIDRYLPDTLKGLEPHVVRSLLNELADKALSPEHGVVCLTAPELVAAPAELRRADGHSIYEPYGSERYATTEQLTREERLLTMAKATGGRRLDGDRVAKFMEWSTLGSDQAAAVSGIVTSNKRVEILLGPAGTGKTYAMGQAAELWEAEGGTTHGLALSENAARLLGEAGIEQVSNVAKFLTMQKVIATGKASEAQVRAFTLGPRSLVVFDETSMISTAQLDEAMSIAHKAGAKILLTGDDRQLGAVGASGAMRLLINEVGAHRLDEVRRFKASWEGTASLQLRDGNAEALVEYNRRGRFSAGNYEEMVDQAYRGFLADYLGGRSSLLIVSTNEAAAELSSRVREDLVKAGKVEARGHKLHDNTTAGVGDLIQTRSNDWKVKDRKGRKVLNRDVYVVTGVLPNGSLRGRLKSEGGKLGPRITLPEDYVANHTELAYAVTMQGAQGRTVQRSHSLVEETQARSSLYVAMTRGTESNRAYVVTHSQPSELGDEVNREPIEVLTAIVERNDEAEKSATEVMREEFDASESLARLGPMWSDGIAEDSRRRYKGLLADVLGDEAAKKVDEDEAASPLYRLIRSAETAGRDPRQVVTVAVRRRELASAESVAEVLHWRISRDLEGQAKTKDSGWQRRTFAERTPAPEHLEGPERESLTGADPANAYGPYARKLAAAMDRRVDELGHRAVEEQPQWAIESIGPLPDEPLAREEWTQRAAVVAAYREQYQHDDKEDVIGKAPSRESDPERHEAWSQAWGALDKPDRASDMRLASEGELSIHVTNYERELVFAPPYIGDELRQAHDRVRVWEEKVARKQAGLESQEQTKTSSAKVLADQARARVAALEEVAAARAEWAEHTKEKAELHSRAVAERKRRRPDDKTTSETPVEKRGQHDLSQDAGLSQAVVQARAVRQLIQQREAAKRAAEADASRTAYESRKREANVIDRGIDRGQQR